MERTGPPDDEITYDFFAIFQQGWPFVRVPYMSSDKARNDMARALLSDETGLTHLVMLDIDHRHDKDTVYRLASHVAEHPERLVVGGLNFRRGAPHDPCVFFVEDDGRYYQMATWPNEPFRVDILGTGCVIIAREVFERTEYPWFYRDLGTLDDPRNAGDDVTFSLRCRDAGIELWCDPRISSPHMTEKWVTARTYLEYVRDHASEFEPERVEAIQTVRLD